MNNEDPAGKDGPPMAAREPSGALSSRLRAAGFELRPALAHGPRDGNGHSQAIPGDPVEDAAEGSVAGAPDRADEEVRALAERLRVAEGEAERARASLAEGALREETLRAAAERERGYAVEARARAQVATIEATSARFEAIEASARMRAAIDEAASLRGELARVEETAATERRDVEAAAQRASIALQEVDSLRDATTRAGERVTALAADLERARDEVERARRDATEAEERATAATIAAAQARADADSSASAEASTRLAALAAEQAVAVERAEREQATSDLRAVTQRLNVSVDEAGRARIRAQDIEKSFEAATQDAAAARAQAESLTREADELRRQAREARSELVSVRAERESAQAQLAEVRVRAQEMTGELATLRARADEAGAALRVAEAEATHARTRSEASERQLAQAMTAIEATTAEAASARARAAEAERRVDTLTAARLTFVGDSRGELIVTPRGGEAMGRHDPLTELPDRGHLLARLAEEIQRTRDGGAPVSLLLLDIDSFKDINNTFGHQTGDRIIKQMAERIRTTVRGEDIVSRLGGDEFAVVLPGLGVEEAVEVVRAVLQVIERPFSGPDQEFDIQASVGVATHPGDETSAEELLRRADVAMYVAKRSRGGYVVYSADDDEHNPERLLLLGDLRRAIVRDELSLFWQPQVKFTTGQIVGMEALVRWNHPRRGLLPPAAFVPLAERTGVIKPLHDWVLRAALRQCKAWSETWDRPVVAVNTSMPNVLDPSYVDIVQRMLLETEVAPSSLCVEITESVIMGDPERARGVVSDLRTMGVRVSIDDFGTGYSSLGYLQQLDVNEIKIDKSFVTGVADDRARAAIVRTSIDLGHHFGLEVVAEGVEDQRSWDILFTTACDTAQGYHISPPLPSSEVVRSLAERGWIRQGSERGFRITS